ncbi:MAG: phosphoglycerate kinase [Candidatus Heimdallarchaeota archaeon]|nr:phosphoglycerate kinase [Candidatus Heimdallarchaeota archaeon]MDH5644678.1 phosphoglycerate kinase [Candidatus Heimdallarchaeota archaeon]
MIKSIADVNLQDKTVLCRVDYNVPIENQQIQDDERIVRSLNTINYLLKLNCKIILCSHLGRPKGIDSNLSLKPIADHLEKLLNQNVTFIEALSFERIKVSIDSSTNKVILLENIRFHEGETKNNEELSQNLANLAEIFVSDAFGTVHRAHASTVGVTRYIPGYAGYLVNEEYEKISKAMYQPDKPVLAIIGGSKVSTKIDLIKKFVESVNTIVIGGGMSFTFFKMMGYNVGNSLVEDDMLETAKYIIETAEKNNVSIILPADIKLSKTFNEPWLEDGEVKIVSVTDIPDESMGLDIGPKTINLILESIRNANTIFWNGPQGVFEKELYRTGTVEIAREIINKNTTTIIGGGDTAYALKYLNQEIPENIHLSTGGGATLELLSGIQLPGIMCLQGKILN